MLLLYFLRYSLPKNILEQNKEVYTENVSYGYIFCWTTRKYYYEKMKEHKIGKKEYWKKVEWNLYYCLYFSVTVRQSFVQFYLQQEKLFS